MKIKTKVDRRRRIKLRVRRHVHGTGVRPRLAVFRSVGHMYAQAIDDMTGQTLASAATTEAALKTALAAGPKGRKLTGAKTIGKTIAERLQAKGIKQVVFDRGGFLYHGRVKAVADAARAAGLEF
jgi:large subunit ribosomal protein L18